MLTVLLAQTSNDGGGDGWLAALAFLAVAAAIALIQSRARGADPTDTAAEPAELTRPTPQQSPRS
ncbi:MAG: hypothetical protein MUE34_01745 [Acidimicrobiales bacterium]|nr:hypothetical protein [Acidimicrobiales bacterium]